MQKSIAKFSIFVAVLTSWISTSYSKNLDASSKTQSESKAWLGGNFSSSLDYIYFSFQGTQAAKGNIYDFEDVQLDLQMFTLKYSPSSLVSYSLVATYQTNYAETYFDGYLFSDRTHGLSDTLLKRTQVFVLPAQQVVILEGGIYLPTGSINEKNQSNVAFNYPYNMQLGSGTIDPMVTAIYIKTLASKHQFGALGLARLRTGENNSNGYHLGHDWTGGLWYSYLLNPFITPSLKLNYRSIEGVSGMDPLLRGNTPESIALYDRYMNFYHNTRSVWDFTPAINFKYPIAKHVTAQALVGLPVWQKFNNVDHVEVETQWYGQLGITVQ